MSSTATTLISKRCIALAVLGLAGITLAGSPATAATVVVVPADQAIATLQGAAATIKSRQAKMDALYAGAASVTTVSTQLKTSGVSATPAGAADSAGGQLAADYAVGSVNIYGTPLKSISASIDRVRSQGWAAASDLAAVSSALAGWNTGEQAFEAILGQGVQFDVMSIKVAEMLAALAAKPCGADATCGQAVATGEQRLNTQEAKLEAMEQADSGKIRGAHAHDIPPVAAQPPYDCIGAFYDAAGKAEILPAFPRARADADVASWVATVVAFYAAARVDASGGRLSSAKADLCSTWTRQQAAARSDDILRALAELQGGGAALPR